MMKGILYNLTAGLNKLLKKSLSSQQVEQRGKLFVINWLDSKQYHSDRNKSNTSFLEYINLKYEKYFFKVFTTC